jgi:ABC-type uncharacterized transport system ATPase subunit
MVYGDVDDVRRRYSRSEVRVHAHGPLPTLPSVANVIKENEDSWRLMLANGTAPSDVLATLVGAGLSIDRFEPMLAPMEDIFLHIVSEGKA